MDIQPAERTPPPGHPEAARRPEVLRVLSGRETRPMTAAQLHELARGASGVALDLGAGDGRYVYRMALRQPDRLWIGVDPSQESLSTYAGRLGRKPSRGGVPRANALFVVAAVESLPTPLDGLAGIITIHLPWGSLLRGLVLAEPNMLQAIARAAAPDATIHLYLNTTAFLERVPGELRDLPVPTVEHADMVLVPAYAKAGIHITERRMLGRDELAALESTWARRLAQARAPQALYLQGVCNPVA